jgi:hypothetical protein
LQSQKGLQIDLSKAVIGPQERLCSRNFLPVAIDSENIQRFLGEPIEKAVEEEAVCTADIQNGARFDSATGKVTQRLPVRVRAGAATVANKFVTIGAARDGVVIVGDFLTATNRVDLDIVLFGPDEQWEQK